MPKDVDFIEVNQGLERSRQRNIGIENSVGNVIMWLDSDMSIDTGLVKECEGLIKMGYSCVYVPEVIVAKSFFGKIRKFEREFYTGTWVDVPRVVAKNHCPRFNEELHGPEDADFGNRIKGIRAISTHCIYHHDDITLFEYLRKKTYYTKSMERYAELNPGDPCLNIWYRCVVVFVERGKWKKLLRHPVLSLGILFLLLARGIIYARR